MMVMVMVVVMMVVAVAVSDVALTGSSFGRQETLSMCGTKMPSLSLDPMVAWTRHCAA